VSDEHDDYEDEVGAEGNRIIGGRAKAVVEHVTRSIAEEPAAEAPAEDAPAEESAES